MTNAFDSMTEAMRLTRSGNVMAATEMIQSMLSRTTSPDVTVPVTDTASPRLAPTAARAGSFVERRYTGVGGALSYWVYTPPGAKPGMPLVVMLHGCTQSPEDFARGTGMNRLADELGFLVVYPGQAQAANAQKCWNWFKPGDQQRDAGEPALIAGVTRAVIAEQDVDPARVYVAGLSAGGAAAAIMGAAYPDLYAAIGVHSGLACGSARDLPSALAAMRSGAKAASKRHGFVPVIVFHGDRDTTVNALNGRAIAQAAIKACDTPLRTQTENGTAGRGYTRVSSVDADGVALVEEWTVHGAGHAWSGGDPAGSYADATGPDASRAMLRFFLAHRRG